MRTMNRLFVLPCLLALAGGCSDDPFQVSDDELLVVRAFLYAGEPVEEVELTRTLALDSEEEPEAVSNARVYLLKGGNSYELTPTSDAPGFYGYPGADLAVEVGDTFQLRVEWQDQVVLAETVVPSPPEELTLSSDVMEVPEWSGGFGGGGPGGPGSLMGDPLVVRWANPEGDYYFLTVDNLESDPEPLPFTDLFLNRPIRFTSQPVTSDSLYVNLMTLTHYGSHEVVLYQVNEEYAELYQGRTQDSRDLNEPPSNIDGGLGVFSAFAGRKAHFTAVPEEG